MASYPGQVPSFTTKVDITDVVYAAHPNSIQSEVVAIATVLGVNPHINPVPNASTAFITAATTWGSVGARLANIENGVIADSHSQYPKVAGGSTIQPSAAGVVGLNVRAQAAQTANLQEWRNSSNTVVTSIDAGGNLLINGAALPTPANLEELKAVVWLGAANGVGIGI